MNPSGFFHKGIISNLASKTSADMKLGKERSEAVVPEEAGSSVTYIPPNLLVHRGDRLLTKPTM